MIKRMAAFTVMETIVVLALVALVMAMAHSSLGHVNSYWQGFQNRHRQEAAFLLCQQALRSDLGACAEVLESAEGLVFRKGSHLVEYRLDQGLLIRQPMASRPDTLAHSVLAMDCFFMGLPVTTGSFSRIDEIRLGLALGDRHYLIHLEKHYDALTLMEPEKQE